MVLIKVSFIVLCGIVNIQAARILAIYPCPSISHQFVFRPITLELLKRGHHVTVATTDPMFSKGNAPDNLTEIDLHDVSYEFVKNYTDSVRGIKSDLVDQLVAGAEFLPQVLEKQVKIKDFQDLISNEAGYFDLILLEALYTPGLGISHLFKAPVILISSFGAYIDTYDIVGAPTHPILYPNTLRQRLYNLTPWDKINEVYTTYRIKRAMNGAEDNLNKALKRIFGPTTPDINVLKNNVDLLILNVHPVWEGNFPVPPNVIHVAGLHQKPAKPLPNDLQDYLDSSVNGVVYFSFGTNVKPSFLPRDKISIFEKVFSQLPYNVLWKWDSDSYREKSSNVKIFKWLPQSDLLRHPNIKVFITQGGLQSTDEAITAGVPLVGIPMLGDQWYNVEKYGYHKIGVGIDFEHLTEEKLKNAIIEVIEDKRYRDNIVRLRSLMQDQPQKPLERAMWWIEYVLRHGGAKHLRSPAANISWTEYLEIELVSVVILSFSLVIFLAVVIIKKLAGLIQNVIRPKIKIKHN